MVCGDNPSPSGYLRGLSQPAQVVSLHLIAVPCVVSWEALDRWLEGWLDESPRLWLPSSDGLGGGEDVTTAARLARRVALWAESLLRSAGIPIFEPGELLTLHRADGQADDWQCELAVSCVAEVPAEAIALAYEVATAWVLAQARCPGAITLSASLEADLEVRVLPTLLATAVASPSAMAILRAANARDIPWRHEGGGIYCLGWGRHALHFHNSRIDSDSSLGISATGNKLLAAQWLRRAGIPAPVHHVVTHVDQAVEAAHTLGWPVVVKPVDRDRGEGVCVNVTDEGHLCGAFAEAARFSPQVLVERQVAGTCHRILVVHGKVMYVVKRLPVAVLGDGKHTAADLIKQQNGRWRQQPLPRRPPPLPDDALARACLRDAGLGLDDIVPAGMWAPLRLIESTADGGRDEDLTNVLHPDNAAIAIQAAEVFGLDMAGIDIISTDIGVPWHTNGAIINEVNASPTLGASESSIDAMPATLAQLIAGNGRIPIEVFIGGGNAVRLGLERQREIIDQGRNCYFTSATHSVDASGNTLMLASPDLHSRCMAFLRNTDVDALILATTAQALEENGLPVDRVDRQTDVIHIMD